MAMAAGAAVPLMAWGWATTAAVSTATVTTWSALQTAVTSSGTVTLGTTISTPSGTYLSVPSGASVTLDLHGHKLAVTSPPKTAAAIEVTGALTIETGAGGTGAVTATGTTDGAGIGGGRTGSGGTVTINGGFGGSGGTTTISGGTVTATGGYAGAGIGGGGGTGSGGTILISGPSTVHATGGGNAAGIGNGLGGSGGTITIGSGSTVHASATIGSSAIGGGTSFSVTNSGTLTVEGWMTVPTGTLTNSTTGVITLDTELECPPLTNEQIINQGTIVLGKDGYGAKATVSPMCTTVTEHDYAVTFKTVGVNKAAYASSFASGNVTFVSPSAPYVWADTAGVQVTATTDLATLFGERATGATSVTLHLATTPTAPALSAATPGDGTATLAWSAPSSTGGTPITGYLVFETGTKVATVTAPTTTYRVAGLTNGTSMAVDQATGGLLAGGRRRGRLQLRERNLHGLDGGQAPQRPHRGHGTGPRHRWLLGGGF